MPTFSLDAVLVNASFGLDADIVPARPRVTHDRTDSHFATQDDTVITVTGIPGYLDEDLLSLTLADLFDRVTTLVPAHAFGLDAVIEAAASNTESDSFGLDAVIAYGGTFGLSAILRWTRGRAFGLAAVIAPGSRGPNEVMSEGATYSAISSSGLLTGPERAANQSKTYDFATQAWEKDSGTAVGDWWQVNFLTPRRIDQVIVYNTQFLFAASGSLEFSDGSTVTWSGATATAGPAPRPENPFIIDFSPRVVASVRIVSDGNGHATRPSIAEVEVYDTQRYT